jgi:hypothetical protein
MSDQENSKQFEIKDTYTVEGITGEYVWYNYKKLLSNMKTWQFDFEKVVSVMEARHKEHLVMIEDLLRQNKNLKIQLKEAQEK